MDYAFPFRNIIYAWEIQYANGSKVFTEATDKITSTGFKKQNLVINAGQLREDQGYDVILVARYSDVAASTRITLTRKTSVLPHSGACSML